MIGKICGIVVAFALVGCMTRDAYDIRPESDGGVPTAVAWQNSNDRRLAEATDAGTLARVVASSAVADALLAKVETAYATDPLVASQVAAVTQHVMDPATADGSRCRDIWRAALLKAAETSADGSRTVFFLEQLRWCATVADVPAIRRIAAASDRADVQSFAAVVVRELERAALDDRGGRR